MGRDVEAENDRGTRVRAMIAAMLIEGGWAPSEANIRRVIDALWKCEGAVSGT